MGGFLLLGSVCFAKGVFSTRSMGTREMEVITISITLHLPCQSPICLPNLWRPLARNLPKSLLGSIQAHLVNSRLRGNELVIKQQLITSNGIMSLRGCPLLFLHFPACACVYMPMFLGKRMRSAGVCVPGHTRVRGGMGPPLVAELLARSTLELATFWGCQLSASAG